MTYGLSLGIDLGTSGVRSAVVDNAGNVVSQARGAYPKSDPDRVDATGWWDGAAACLHAQISALTSAGIDPMDIARIGVDGTSGSMVLTDAKLTPVTRALMYNSGNFGPEAAKIAAYAPDPHITRGDNSAAARALRLVGEDSANAAAHLLHQADYIAAKLIGKGGYSDHNNALKTGFDPQTECWPDWFADIGLSHKLLPDVLPAGRAVAEIHPLVAQQFGISPKTIIHVGTTDSIAAFLAAAPLSRGAAVTSIGTTLAIKMLSGTRIDDPEIGLYSHRLGNEWLVGGASNTGGGVLMAYFSVAEITQLSSRINPQIASPLDYYPLLSAGERFPINDPNLQPRLTPRPPDDAAFLYGMLESIARIERQAYAEMKARGAPDPTSLFTAGGGASNPIWTAIRSRVLGLDIQTAKHVDAAIGTAYLIAGLG